MAAQISAGLIFNWTAFTLFLFYQTKLFQGAERRRSPNFDLLLFAYLILGYLFYIAFLVLYGYVTSWYWPFVLFALSVFLKMLFFSLSFKLEIKATSENFVLAMGVLGLVVLPISGYFLVALLPPAV